MPVMVVGADTEVGDRIIRRFLGLDREVRAFVTDPEAAEWLRSAGAKVALGDVSDDSHLSGACLNCFSVVLVADAASDDRRRSFARSRETVFESWARAVATAGVQRAIWVVDDERPPSTAVAESAVVRRDDPDLVDAVYRLDAAASLDAR